ncbi:hypothetical protein EDD36DRAFT_465238 [Exophiala viscosa]|uniref:BZIP domain-containing protein n=1 Tax=Exophiala viscosa TaxID=2486360 RepID=A0AAN6ID50_9EURO|nr:hypothetical protein EDD36DRAFT_465238 [Exophiala viscosa]
MASKTKARALSASEPAKRNENTEIRKLRNRISQKAFRARQQMRMKELEDRLHNGSYSDAEWMTHLQDQNSSLREQLLECHKKFTSLQVSMKALANASALALGIDSLDGVNDSESSGNLCARCKRAEVAQDEDPLDVTPSLPSNKTDVHTERPKLSDSAVDEPLSANSDNNNQADHAQYLVDDQELHVPQDSAAVTLSDSQMDFVNPSENHPGPEINLDYLSTMEDSDKFDMSNDNRLLVVSSGYCADPLSMDLIFSEDLGPRKYKNILEMSPSVVCKSFDLKKTNSPFSDHIDALERCVLWSYSRWSASQMLDDRLTNPIGSILMTFVSMSWQPMTAWHTYTKAHIPLRELMAWRICRTPDRYLKVSPAYQPTRLQMSVPYPSIIDWIPFPQLRDKLIMHHAANPCLDSIICDIGNSYVVPADLSLLIKCPQALLGYVGAWDLVRAIAPEATGSPEPSPTSEDRQWHDDDTTNAFGDLTLPAKDANTLFSSRELAAQAFKVLGVDNGAFNFRLDPAFFGRHPELYDNNSDLMALGVALRPGLGNQIPIIGPEDVKVSVVAQYQEMSRYLIDSALESRHSSTTF